MNHRRRLGISSPAFIAITLACIFIVFALCMLLVSSVIGGSQEKVESTQRRLIYATNPALLMDACRQLAASSPSVDGPTHPDPTSPSMPAIVRKVRPRTITIENDRVTLECGTNVYRFGLCVDLDTPAIAATAVSTTGPTTRAAPPMATRQIAPGVWYYAEDRAVPGP